MRHSRHILTREELSALLATSATIDPRGRGSLRETAARLLKRLADRIAGQKLS